METLLIFIATILVALLAGIFLAYSISVIPALRRAGDQEYVRTMQNINIVIQNPVFFLVFMGPVLLLPIISFLAYDPSNNLRFYALVGASTLYILGSFFMTVLGNVPLNERLARVNVSQASEVAKARSMYEKPWNKLHSVRTIFSMATASILIIIPYI